jgi:L-fucose mutarotase
MLKGQLIHPEILAALAGSGHGSMVLISDGNYPHGTRRGPNAKIVYLNLAPGMVTCTDVLKTLVTAINIEKADVMDYARTGPNSLEKDPPIWNEFREILHASNADLELSKIERFKFYDAASTPEVCLTIATGDQRIYANLLLTIGVVKPPP